jgi:hypothetical protein
MFPRLTGLGIFDRTNRDAQDDYVVIPAPSEEDIPEDVNGPLKGGAVPCKMLAPLDYDCPSESSVNSSVKTESLPPVWRFSACGRSNSLLPMPILLPFSFRKDTLLTQAIADASVTRETSKTSQKRT